MKKFFLNLLGILLFGAILSGMLMYAEHVRIEREKETTAVSTRYQIVVRTAYIIEDVRITIPGNQPTSPYRLKIGQKADIVVDFTNEPEIRAFYKAHPNEYFRVEGIMRTEKSETESGELIEWQVLEVLKLKVLKMR